jgi:parvulin-like peptidyl-prolyl isomerase
MMSDDERREHELNRIVETLARVAEQRERDAAESAARDRQRERQIDFILEQQARDIAGDARRDRRLDRIERIAKLFVNAGRRARREALDQDRRITALVEAQFRGEAETSSLRTKVEQTTANVNRLADTVRQLATKSNGNGANGKQE